MLDEVVKLYIDVSATSFESDNHFRAQFDIIHTSFLLINVHLHSRVLKWPPFKVFLVTATLHVSSLALLTSWLLFTTLETFRFAGDTACMSNAVSITPSDAPLPTMTPCQIMYHCGFWTVSACWPFHLPLR
jgi:hypothetical protein